MYRKFIATWLITALVLLIAANFIPGLIVKTTNAALYAALILGLVNAVFRPVLLTFTSFPLTLISFSFFVFIINSTTIWLTSVLSPGFQVTGFTPTLMTAIILALIASGLNSKFVKQED